MSEDECEKCFNFYKESFLNRKEYINQLEKELSKYKGKLNKINECYLIVITKLENYKDSLYGNAWEQQQIQEIINLIKYYIPEPIITDGTEGVQE